MVPLMTPNLRNLLMKKLKATPDRQDACNRTAHANYRPVGTDPQKPPHARKTELYVIAGGSGDLAIKGETETRSVRETSFF